MADFLVRPHASNTILDRTATLYADAGDAFSAGATTPGLGSLAGAKGEADIYEEAAGLKEPTKRYPGDPQRPPDSAYEDYRTRVMAPEELREKYGHLGLEFDAPMSEGAARVLASVKHAELLRNDILTRANSSAGVAAGFAGGLISMLTDPLELATVFIPVVGQTTKGAALARLGAVRGRIAVGAAEGFAGNLLTEPLYGGMARSLQLDYTMADALLNLGFGAVLGGGFGAAAGLLARRSAGGPRVDTPLDPTATATRAEANRILAGLPAQSREQALGVALSQFAQGKRVDVGDVFGLTPDVRQTLSGFVAARGGIKDGTGTGPDFRVDEDRMAQLAYDAGFLARPSRQELADALADEAADKVVRLNATRSDPQVDGPTTAAGRPQSSSAPQLAQDGRPLLDGPQSAPTGPREPIPGSGGPPTGGPETPLQRASRARLEIAARRQAREAAAVRSAGQKATAPETDYTGDVAAARAADDVEEFDPLLEDDANMTDMIEELRRSGELPPDAERALADVAELEAKAAALGRTARVAAACLLR